MPDLILTKRQLNSIKAKKELYSGSESTLYLVDNYLLMKINNILSTELLWINKLTSNKALELSKTISNQVQSYYEKQSIINKTILPLGCIKCNNYLVGTILHYFKDYYTINEYYTHSMKLIFSIFLNTLVALKELTDAYIYPLDIHQDNILVNKDNYCPAIIDLEGTYIKSLDHYDNDSYIRTYNMFKSTIFSYINIVYLHYFNNYKTEKYINKKDIQEFLNISSDSINFLFTYESSYEQTYEVLEELLYNLGNTEDNKIL